MKLLAGKAINPLLLICFFTTGVCGLVYEIAWLRVMSVVFGNTTFATSTILSSYMAGLGFGALYFGRRIDSSKSHPIHFYARLEGGVGVYALATPLIWKLIEWVSVGFYRGFEPSYIVFNLFKFGIAFAALFLPTFLMGGTLPVVAKYFVRQKEDTGRFVGLLYALNTLGAVIGVLVSGFYAMYAVGVWQCVILAGCVNILIFYIFLFYKPEAGSVPANEPEKLQESSAVPEGQVFRPAIALSLLCMFGFSGAVSMMYEVGWTRVLAIVLGSSVYAFSVMLATFLLGITLGSYLFTVWIKWIRADLLTFSVLQFLTAISVFWGINLFNDLPFYFVQVFDWSKGNMMNLEFGKFLLCAFIMIVPTLCIGAMFTCFIHVFRFYQSLGKEVGRAYFANTVGTILGSALTGFMILPLIGIQKTLFLGAAINGIIGLTSFVLYRPNFNWKRLSTGMVLGCAVLGMGFGVRPWNINVIAADTAVKPKKLVGLNKNQFQQEFRKRSILFYKEGLSATVSVTKVKDNTALAVNGKVDASNDDAFTQYLLGHLPLLMHDDPKKVLVIGYGSGSTVAAVAAHPVDIIHAVELEEEVVNASVFFKDLNRDVLNDPRVEMFVNDGRNFLLVRPDKYDAIISEPSNPWMAGIASLFSREHFMTLSKRLKPGGIVCQWLHAYSMDPSDLAMILKTFSLGFKHVQLWSAFYPDLMLIGSNDVSKIDFKNVERGMGIPQVLADLRPYGIRSPEALFGSYWFGNRSLRRLVADAGIHTDNKPVLEFSAPRNLYKNTLGENFEFINSARDYNYPVKNVDPPVRKSARFHNELVRALTAKKMYQDAVTLVAKSDVLEPGNTGLLEVRGILKFETKAYEQALEDLQKAAALNPGGAEIQFYLGQTYMALKKTAEALTAFKAAVAFDSGNKLYLEALGNAMFKAKRYAEALQIYERRKELHGMSFEVMKAIADIHARMSGDSLKIEAFRNFIDAYPAYAPGYQPLGHLYEKQSNMSAALEMYQRYAELVPGDANAHLSLARVYERIGESDLMLRSIEEAVRIKPDLAKHPEIKKLLA